MMDLLKVTLDEDKSLEPVGTENTTYKCLDKVKSGDELGTIMVGVTGFNLTEQDVSIVSFEVYYLYG